MNARQYICNKYGMPEDSKFSICYRVIENGSLVEQHSIDDAVEMFNRDLEEMQFVLAPYDCEHKAFEATCKIWDKHLVVW